MAKPLHIKIKNQCHENWENMTSNERGAFCRACQKNVIDFTGKTSNEIYDLVSQSKGNMCGRFYDFQIAEPIVKLEVKRSFLNWKAMAAGVAALIAADKSFAGGNNQLRVIPVNTETSAEDTASVKSKKGIEICSWPTEETRTIKGKVVDCKTRRPIKGAVITQITLTEEGLYSITSKGQPTSVTNKKGEFITEVDPKAGAGITITAADKYEKGLMYLRDFLKKQRNGKSRILIIPLKPYKPRRVLMGAFSF